MSSIFNTSYSDSIRRVDSNSSTNVNQISNQQISGQGEKFTEILSSHQKSDVTNARASLDYRPLEAKPDSKAQIIKEAELTNLSFTETQDLVNGNELPLSYKKSALQAYNISTKELTLESIEGKPPGVPKVISARLTEVEAPKPILPIKPVSIKTAATTEDLLEELIGAAGRHHGIDPNLSVAIARAESSLKVNAVSSDGHHSKGIFQLLDNTGKEMMDRLSVNGIYQPFDPKLNAHLGVGYLRRLHDLFSKETKLTSNLKTIPVKSGEDLEKISIAAFNAGEGRVARAQQLALAAGKDPSSYDALKSYLPVSTRTYVQRVNNLKSVAEARDDETSIA